VSEDAQDSDSTSHGLLHRLRLVHVGLRAHDLPDRDALEPERLAPILGIYQRWRAATLEGRA
jgi:hypothetical protein